MCATLALRSRARSGGDHPIELPRCEGDEVGVGHRDGTVRLPRSLLHGPALTVDEPRALRRREHKLDDATHFRAKLGISAHGGADRAERLRAVHGAPSGPRAGRRERHPPCVPRPRGVCPTSLDCAEYSRRISDSVNRIRCQRVLAGKLGIGANAPRAPRTCQMAPARDAGGAAGRGRPGRPRNSAGPVRKFTRDLQEIYSFRAPPEDFGGKSAVISP